MGWFTVFGLYREAYTIHGIGDNRGTVGELANDFVP